MSTLLRKEPDIHVQGNKDRRIWDKDKAGNRKKIGMKGKAGNRNKDKDIT